MPKCSLHHGDSRDVLATLPDNHFDSVVCDPPYALVSITKRFKATSLQDPTQTSARSRAGADGYARLAKGFMGKEWDNGQVAFDPAFWEGVRRVLKPGGHLLAFGGTRTYHRLVCAIEDAGFEIRDAIVYGFGSGFPKSHNVSKGVDKLLGAIREKVRVAPPSNPPNLVGGVDSGGDRPWRQKAEEVGYHEVAGDTPITPEAARWDGWGTALKPAVELICLARRPLSEPTVAANVLRWGTGALNIDACRVGVGEYSRPPKVIDDRNHGDTWPEGACGLRNTYVNQGAEGRWPADFIHDNSPEVVALFPDSKGQQGDVRGTEPSHTGDENTSCYGEYGRVPFAKRGDSGSAARYFYHSKASKRDRRESKHPTVKPIDLLRYLARLVTPPGGTLLDPFAGSGTTGEAALLEGFNPTLIEREEEYYADIQRRMLEVEQEWYSREVGQ